MLDFPSAIFYPFSFRSIRLYVFGRIRMLAVVYWLLWWCCMLLGLIGLASAWYRCHRSHACSKVPPTFQRLLKPLCRLPSSSANIRSQCNACLGTQAARWYA